MGRLCSFCGALACSKCSLARVITPPTLASGRGCHHIMWRTLRTRREGEESSPKVRAGKWQNGNTNLADLHQSCIPESSFPPWIGDTCEMVCKGPGSMATLEFKTVTDSDLGQVI